MPRCTPRCGRLFHAGPCLRDGWPARRGRLDNMVAVGAQQFKVVLCRRVGQTCRGPWPEL